MPSKRSEKNEYRVVGSVLDELGLDRQATLELKLKAELHQNILQLVKRRAYRARDLERILQIQQPRVSELMRGKLSTLSVARLLLYADLLGAKAEVKLRRPKPTQRREAGGPEGCGKSQFTGKTGSGAVWLTH